MLKVENQPVVIDISTRLTMVGFAGEDYPRFMIPTVVGFPTVDTPRSNDYFKEYYVGQELLETIPLRLVYPVKGGIVQDWNAIRIIYAVAFDLLEATPSECRVVSTKNVYNPQEHQKRTRQILFGGFQVSHLFVVTRSVLSMIGSGYDTGIVIDLEPDYTFIVPVYQGVGIEHAVGTLGPLTATGMDNSTIAREIGVLLEKVDTDIHSQLCNNIVLTGSAATIPNLRVVLFDEVQRINPSLESFRILDSPDRMYLSWRGASVFGSMDLYDELCMSREEFAGESGSG